MIHSVVPIDGRRIILNPLRKLIMCGGVSKAGGCGGAQKAGGCSSGGCASKGQAAQQAKQGVGQAGNNYLQNQSKSLASAIGN
jgi:hypothetical protein